MKLIIDRAKWLRGEGSRASYLLREADGKMCCLGFACLATGLQPEQITRLRTPLELSIALLPTWVYRAHGTTLNEIYGANDDRRHRAKDREEKIQQLLKPLGFEVEFIDSSV